MTYQPHIIEPHWIKQWQTTPQTPPSPDKPPYYVLEMFPYPSGQLHVGHVRNYTIGDCIARFKQMTGHHVLHPFGFDAFGLPAENAAIKHGVSPQTWTDQNMDTMTQQLKRLGIGYSWQQPVATCTPDYYRHTQWLFLELYRRGLIERRKGWVNWDPVDQTVLANEQVIDGRGWRSNALVEKREIEQWVVKITAYADELLSGLDRLPHWPERVKTMQRHWIGKRTGTEVIFQHTTRSIPVFTTRPDTLFGVVALVLSPEHEAIGPLLQDHPQASDRKARLAEIQRRAIDPSQSGGEEMVIVPLDTTVTHPLTQDAIPVYVSDYVSASFGSGALMAVPAHDERDMRFATQAGLPIIPVVTHPEHDTLPMVTPGILINSGPYSGLDSESAQSAITHALHAKGLGGPTVTYRLRDWLISRQRYWGTPIPMAYDELGTPIPLPDDQLPVCLPTDVTFGQGNPLDTSPSFGTVSVNGQRCRRETDTMDTFMDSSWYFLRFADPTCADRPCRPDQVAPWLPVAHYIGGIEHAILHLLYARFMTKVFRDLGLVSVDEPFERLVCQGMVIKEGAKMSKSLGNVVEPGPIIETYGADTLRVFILFGAPVERDLEWSMSGIEGAHRFLNRLWRVVTAPQPTTQTERVTQQLHATIKAVTHDIERLGFNTAIARLMELVNTLTQHGSTPEIRDQLVRLLAPFAPMMAQELWHRLGHHGWVHDATFPVHDEGLLIEDQVTVVVQVNGKTRDTMQVDKGCDAPTLEALARASEKGGRFVAGISVKKVIVVPDKLINFVGGPA